MKGQCVLCGRDIQDGIVCDGCDRRRKPRAATPGASAEIVVDDPLPLKEDPFPKAPIVPFPLESTSLALTSIYEILTTAEIPAILLGADRRVRFASPQARELLGAGGEDPITPDIVARTLGIELPPAEESLFTEVVLGGRQVNISVIPLSGGAAGTVVMFRPSSSGATLAAAELSDQIRQPLRAIRNELGGIVQIPRSILQRLDGVIDRLSGDRPPTQTLRAIYDTLISEFAPQTEERKIRLQVDAPETSETWTSPEDLRTALSVLLRNSIHYVPRGGQIVLGLRFLEHGGEPSLLFFVMDNGPVVPEELREEIFRDGFEWNPSDPHRSGKDLATARRFATAQGGQAWVESRTGKACTFFLRVPAPA